jgi:hypothetical protein
MVLGHSDLLEEADVHVIENLEIVRQLEVTLHAHFVVKHPLFLVYGNLILMVD